MEKIVRDVEFGFAGYREACKLFIKAVAGDCELMYGKRAKHGFSLGEVKETEKYERTLTLKTKLAINAKYEQLRVDR